jgi:hypothetical protein
VVEFHIPLLKWLHLTDFYYVLKYVFISRLTASVVQWSEFLTDNLEVLGSVPALPNFLRSSGSGTGSTQPREDK